MADFLGYDVTAVVMAFYEREDWPGIVSVSSDVNADMDYDVWLQKFTQKFEAVTHAGKRVVRITVRPGPLLAYCRDKGCPVDQKARGLFAARLAAPGEKNAGGH